jgi:hypothetical protein
MLVRTYPTPQKNMSKDIAHRGENAWFWTITLFPLSNTQWNFRGSIHIQRAKLGKPSTIRYSAMRSEHCAACSVSRIPSQIGCSQRRRAARSRLMALTNS